MFAKSYSSGLSRFMAVVRKASSAKPENSESWNRYTYAPNNPFDHSVKGEGGDALHKARLDLARGLLYVHSRLHLNTGGALECCVWKIRPAPCRAFDSCRDPRIGIDFKKRVPNPDLG